MITYFPTITPIFPVGISPVPTLGTVSSAAVDLYKEIQEELILGGIQPDQYRLDAVVIDRIVNGLIWSPKEGFFTCCEENQLNFYNRFEMEEHVPGAFGSLTNGLSTAIALRTEGEKKIKVSEEKRLQSLPWTIVRLWVQANNQQPSVRLTVDPFVSRVKVERNDDGDLSFAIPFEPFKAFDRTVNYEQVVSDYKQHFPKLNEYLSFITACRIAADRRFGALYMKGGVSSGKGFLANCLKELGLIHQLTMKSLERIKKGAPGGEAVEQFIRCWVIYFDEIQYVSSKFKELDNELTIHPHGSQPITVDIYSKLLTTIDYVDSNDKDRLEMNRWDIGKDKIDDTPLFKTQSGSTYLLDVVSYMAEYLNGSILYYQSLGRKKGMAAAEIYLDHFHANYNSI